MSIRIATLADIPALFEVRTSVRDNHLSLTELAALGITPATLGDMLEGVGRGWVVDEAGHIAAFAMADVAQGCVFAMFVRPGDEGRGLGRRLMAEAEGWLFEQGCEELWLLTDSDRAVRANGFYRHLGWQDSGIEVDGQTRFTKRAAA
jgi:GNAT superfamily N-acetyltransferase